MTMKFAYPADFDPDLIDINSPMYTETVEAIASEVHNLYQNYESQINWINNKVSDI